MAEKLNTKIEYVPLSAMFIDMSYQRPLVAASVDRIVAKLDLGAIGVLCVSRRSNGNYAIVDGQHRVEALRNSGFLDESTECEVFYDLSIEDEARIYRERNTRKPVQAVDLFRSRVIEGDATAVAIEAMLTKHGWRVATATASSKGALRSINALERSWELDPDSNPNAAEKAIYVITKAWGHSVAVADASLIYGVAAVFARYGDAVDAEDMWQKLAKLEGGPRGLVGQARTIKALHGGALHQAVAEIVVATYNKHLRTRQLANWRI